MGLIWNICAFVFVLGVMVLVHELGHFLAARYFDVKVDAFAIGFGPRLFGFRGKETDYKICILPIGGFVKMAGENPAGPPGSPRDFLAKPRWQRIIIALGGPVFNFILAIVLLAGLFMVRYEKMAFLDEPARIGFVEDGSAAQKAEIEPGDVIVAIDGQATPTWESVMFSEIVAVNSTIQVTVERDGGRFDIPVVLGADERGAGDAGWAEESQVRLGNTMPGMPAEKAGIQAGDVLVAINTQQISSVRQVPQEVQKLEGAEAEFEIERGTERLMLRIAPVFHESAANGNAWRIGVDLMAKHEVIQTRLGFADATREAVSFSMNNVTMTLKVLRGLIEQRVSAEALEGPIGIARISGDAAKSGLPQLITVMALISLQLGIFNLLPIPILDGGVITMLLIESLIRRDLSLAVKERVVQVGFLFLIILFAFVMYNDIVKGLAPG
ncbi:MAG: RIP metalloprotease RseP [Acidobacteria bacterium]|nr:RIP metalloprotease RseP [Acidobacteriota bacterium]